MLDFGGVYILLHILTPSTFNFGWWFFVAEIPKSRLTFRSSLPTPLRSLTLHRKLASQVEKKMQVQNTWAKSIFSISLKSEDIVQSWQIYTNSQNPPLVGSLVSEFVSGPKNCFFHPKIPSFGIGVDFFFADHHGNVMLRQCRMTSGHPFM